MNMQCGQSSVGSPLLSNALGFSWGSSKAGDWRHLKAGALADLATDEYQLMAGTLAEAISQPSPAQPASLHGLGFLRGPKIDSKWKT